MQAIRDKGDWEGWLEFFLRGISEVSTQAWETARKVLRLREELRERITSSMGQAAGNALKVLEHLFGRPIISVKEVQALIGTSYPPANDLVAKLAKEDILVETTGYARNRRFMFYDYVELFKEDRP
ncbi:MAG TPA: hypothetical protein ENF90_01370 [Candidatus Bathyarchaeota archaeon]|nr:hypothetical protein [Candidatus Bathyarchaeota archaeon]